MSNDRYDPMLVDCGCWATVHQDGSGIELDYCPTHKAAPEMLEALRACAEWINSMHENYPEMRQVFDRARVLLARIEGASDAA